MLVAYLPKEKILLEADGYNPQPATATPPSPPSPFTVSLVDNIARLKLDVQRIVPVHYARGQPCRDDGGADEVDRTCRGDALTRHVASFQLLRLQLSA